MPLQRGNARPPPGRGVHARLLLVGFLATCTVATARAEPAAEDPPAAGPDGPDPAAGATYPKAAAGAQDGGRRDLSGWLLDGKGFLPVPIVITDPSLGTGGGVGVVRFRRPSASRAAGPDQIVEPHVFGIAAFRTSNGSEGAGAGAMLRLKDDTLRYLGVLGRMSLNLEYHAAAQAHLLPGGIDYNIKGLVSSQSLRYGLSERLYAGLSWIYTDLDATFEVDASEGLFEGHELSRRSSGLGLSVEYDTRDTMLTPSRGWLGAFEGVWYDKAIGSDGDFQTYRAKFYSYAPLGEHLVLAGRLDVRAAEGEVPFYRLPYIELRGIGAARYQDTRAMVLETELRWNATTRIAFVGFAGAGRTWGRRSSFGRAPDRTSRGLGARYRISEAMGLYVGLDYAWGPEEGVCYVQIGSAWR